MSKANEINFIKVGALSAILLALSAIAFFALFRAMSSANPRWETAQFLSDVASKQGIAVTVAWANVWLGFLTIPLYLGLYHGLRRACESYMLLALITGLAWGISLVLATPQLLAIVHYVAPAWINNTDSVSRTVLLDIATTLQWVGSTQIGIVIFFRAVSVLAASRVMLLLSGRLWTGMGWLGIIFAIEHIVTGIQQVEGARGAASTLLGAVGGMMLSVWLIGVAIGLLRLRQEPETSAMSGSRRLSQTSS